MSLNGSHDSIAPGSLLQDSDFAHLERAAHLADSSAGLTQPHPNSACILVNEQSQVVAEAYQHAQGTASAEVQAVSQAGPAAGGTTAYLNLETGDSHGDMSSVIALVKGGVSRVVIGLLHPLPHLRGQAVRTLKAAGVCVDLLQPALAAQGQAAQQCLQACLKVNEALLHRAATGRPLSLLKYAMTADGKIACSSGHSSWVSCPDSRKLVFEARARSDAIIVGGNTVRRDNPRLTTRREGGHAPVRIVMSRTLDLPQDANLWDVSSAPTIVMTQRGARKEFQESLRAKGVEVVQFDFLTPEAVAAYCQERGFLQVLWECGGTLAAPAIAAGVIHKALAFIAPKLIGGVRAPSPVGELGNVEMTQAINLVDSSWQVVGPDVLLTGYLPSSGGLLALQERLAAGAARQDTLESSHASSSHAAAAAAAAPPLGQNGAAPRGAHANGAAPTRRWWRQCDSNVVEFYKSWDLYGALSNFSAHPISMPSRPVSISGALPSAPARQWPSVEHFYQAQKFAGVESAQALDIIEEIAQAASPEEAARIGRRNERLQPSLMRTDWPTAKLAVMHAGLKAKFTQHDGPRALLLSTASLGLSGRALDLVEASPHDFFWGRGVDGSGFNHLGMLLMSVREELLQAEQRQKADAVTPAQNGIISSLYEPAAKH
ncbi:g5780 [Coccomyxa viridis]|uniref:5-amino-6-(5-phosphoribosylamino)uracil reductase n=1 Tax=Coccomyxa viridis TaxID=1274662 RepID=A0ABP1FTR2_9CHLO